MRLSSATDKFRVTWYCQKILDLQGLASGVESYGETTRVNMSKRHEFRWKIDAYSADTMPLDRLAEYLAELAEMLGDAKHLHLLKVETSSTVPVLRIDDEAVERVRQRATDVKRGIAPVAVMQSYRRINVMLRKDKATATLIEGSAEIIPFPGNQEPTDLLSGVMQRGSLDGQLEKIGGARPWVPVKLRSMEGGTVTGCFAKKGLAKELANHLFEPVRLFGRGRWTRTASGQWVLDKFSVETFEKLSADPLGQVVSALRSVKADWRPNPIAEILAGEF